MRTVWTIISWLAVVHLLTLAGFAGWLVVDGRLSGERHGRVCTGERRRAREGRATSAS